MKKQLFKFTDNKAGAYFKSDFKNIYIIAKDLKEANKILYLFTGYNWNDEVCDCCGLVYWWQSFPITEFTCIESDACIIYKG